VTIVTVILLISEQPCEKKSIDGIFWLKLASIIIGLSLGLIGGGDLSLLYLSLYFFSYRVKSTTYSLFIVGFTSMIVRLVIINWEFKMKSAVIFAVPSIVSLLFYPKLILPLIPSTITSIRHC
jgi:hypothetical protein